MSPFTNIHYKNHQKKIDKRKLIKENFHIKIMKGNNLNYIGDKNKIWEMKQVSSILPKKSPLLMDFNFIRKNRFEFNSTTKNLNSTQHPNH